MRRVKKKRRTKGEKMGGKKKENKEKGTILDFELAILSLFLSQEIDQSATESRYSKC